MTPKRIYDLAIALPALLLFFPVLMVLVVLVRLESPGPAIFKQLRVGKKRQNFWCLKLRTMRSDAPNQPTHKVDQQYVTKLGKILRSSKLDELPQLYNVVRGEMSLVGPRPSLTSQHDLIAARSEKGIFELEPGITGLAQVSGIDMKDPTRLARIDAIYLRKRSLRLDTLILVRTISKCGR